MFRRVLILLLAITWLVGPAHCLSGRGAQAGMLICTGAGLATVPWPDAPAPIDPGGGACPVCAAIGHAMPPTPPALPEPASAWALPGPEPARAPPPVRRAVHQGEPRAPPVA